MSKKLLQSRLIAFNLQQSRCIYCEKPIWINQPEEFSIKYNTSSKQTLLFRCTAEHLIAKKDQGNDTQSNIVAACLYCNLQRHRSKSAKVPLAYKQFVLSRLKKQKWNSKYINA